MNLPGKPWSVPYFRPYFRYFRVPAMLCRLLLLSLALLWVGAAQVEGSTLIAQYHLEETAWNGTAGEVKDSAGFGGGPFNGKAIGSPLPSPSKGNPAKSGSTGTCGYALETGPASGGGAFDVTGLPVSTANGDQTSVAFWMYWDGTDQVMPIGWVSHDLFFYNGKFGFNTNNADVYGMDSASLLNGWHHVVAVFTNGSVTYNKLYIDGISQSLQQTQPGTPTLANAVVDRSLRIGGFTLNNSYRFTGRLDEVKVYTGPVSQAEVTALQTETHVCPPDVALAPSVWLKANSLNQADNTAVTSWTNAGSAGGNFGQSTAANMPSFRKNATDNINFNPVVMFDGVDDGLVSASSVLGKDGYDSAFWYIVAMRSKVQDSTLFWEPTVNPAGEQDGRFSFHLPWGDDHIYWDPGSCCILSRLRTAFSPVPSNQPQLWGFNKDKAGVFGGTSQQDIRRNGNVLISRADTGPLTGIGSVIYLGGLFPGRVAEAILYLGGTPVSALKDSELQSYLSIKYGMTRGDNGGGTSYPYVNGSGTTVWSSATYHNDVAGIASDTSFGLNQLVSQNINTGTTLAPIAQIAIASGGSFPSADPISAQGGATIANGGYLLWGHDGGELTTTVIGTSTVLRLTRIWQAQVTGTLPTQVTLRIPAALVPAALLTPAVIVAASTTFASPTQTVALAGPVGGYYTATVSTFTNNDFFTIGTAQNCTAAKSTVVASPTSVAADNLASSTITVTLKNCANAAIAGKVVTLAAGSGGSTISTLGGTTNASGEATFSVKDGTPEIVTYTATTETIVILQTAQVTFNNSLCFNDNFDRPDGQFLNETFPNSAYWTRTKGATTSFDANIVSNRLRLTDTGANRATAVHLFRLFPGADNKVTALFDYYSYGGTAADGLVITLSDSAIAPVAGAFGGSLGYAQKNAAACPPSGCPGFAGGWIGVGLDEYGNFSNPTEGRVDGPGFRNNSVTIRGSGSDYSGYNWQKTVTPVSVTTTSAIAHRYQVIVDHSDGIHAMVSVKRNTAGGANFTETIVSEYDAKAIVTQAAVPPYWYFSFTASTGASANIHEIDNLNICTTQPMVVPKLDHVRLIHDGSALTCAPETITLKACANAECTALFTGSVIVSLPTISGATWTPGATVTVMGGTGVVTLKKESTGTVSLTGATVTSPVATPMAAVVCYNGVTSGDCSLVYSSNACAFDAVEVGRTAGSPIYTKLAGTAFSVDVLALTAGVINTGYTGTVTVGLVDMTVAGRTAGSCNSSWALLASPTNTPSWSSGRRTYTFNYANAAKDVRVRVVAGATTACSSDNFAIRPTSFSVISPNATNTATGGTPFFKAGTTPFGLDAASKTNTTPLTNYTGTAKINSGRIAAHPGAVQAGSVDGVFSPATSASGISKGMAFTYSEVGNFQFLPWGVYDDGSFADVDRGKATPECFIDGKLGSAIVPADPNVKDGNGKYGCYFGGTKPPTSSNTSGGATASSLFFGRFIPDHFLVTAGTTKPACAPPGATNPFTYFGQDFTTEFTLTAQNASGNTTQNYDGNIGYAKLPLTAWGAAPAPGFGFAVGTWSPAQPAGTPAAVLANSATADTAPTPTATNSNTWSAGTTTVTARHMIVRPTSAPAVPTTITVTALPVDSDGVTTLPVTPSTTPSPTLISSTLLLQRFGRLRLIPGQGSNLAPFKMQTEVQYWDGTYWRTNVADSCTTLASGNFAVSGTTGTTASTAAGISQGYGSILLTRPTSVGTATICMDMATTANDCTVTTPPNLGYLLGGPAYNTDPSATVFFGGASSNSRGNWGYLYRRENF